MDQITLNHGSGGRATQDLIQEIFIEEFDNDILKKKEDSAVLDTGEREKVFTTDSYVIRPVFFPGGNLGKLSLTGTMNDLAVMGAKPKWISCGVIIREGYKISDLKKIVHSMAETAKNQDVKVVTGDTKVVEQSSCDGIFINTSGIGRLLKEAKHSDKSIETGDIVLVNGYIGDHAAALISARQDFKINIDINSDCVSLYPLIKELVNNIKGVKFIRDITRGGLATILNEIVQNKEAGIELEKNKIPIRDKVVGLCEPLGYNPLYFANEGKFALIVKPEEAQRALKIMQQHPLGKNSAIIGQVKKEPEGEVSLRTEIGSTRIIGMLDKEIIPRIC